MTQMQFYETVERIKTIGGMCFSMVTPSEIETAALRVDPNISYQQMEALIEVCSQYLQIVSEARKREALATIHPPNLDSTSRESNPSLIDRFYCILMQREMDPNVKEHWLQTLRQDVRLWNIHKSRPVTTPQQLAKSLDISLEAFYALEKEMIKLYYASSDDVRRNG